MQLGSEKITGSSAFKIGSRVGSSAALIVTEITESTSFPAVLSRTENVILQKLVQAVEQKGKLTIYEFVNKPYACVN